MTIRSALLFAAAWLALLAVDMLFDAFNEGLNQ